MKKIIKLIAWTFVALFVFYVFIKIAANGGFGHKVQYYLLKTVYHIDNPKEKATAEIVIDLKKDFTFVLNNSNPSKYVYPFIWDEGLDGKGYIGITTESFSNPFEYFKIKIILDDTTLAIPNAERVVVYFKDYSDPLRRMMQQPQLRGIKSVHIYGLDGQPVLEKGLVLPRKMDYSFAFAQHQQFVSMFTKLGFSQDPDSDEIQKDVINKRLKDGSSVLEYKTWSKENFEFTLMLKLSDGYYFNTIYIHDKII